MWPASQGQYVLASQGQYCSWQCDRFNMALAIFKSGPICSWQVWLVVQWVEAGLSLATHTGSVGRGRSVDGNPDRWLNGSEPCRPMLLHVLTGNLFSLATPANEAMGQTRTGCVVCWHCQYRPMTL